MLNVVARILIVDDDVQTARAVGNRLTAAGYECRIETKGTGVVDVLRENYHLLVLDIMLPDMSGFEICRRVRRDPELYTLPILVLSAMNDEEEVLHGLAQGADDYVVKPFDINNLVKRVDALVRSVTDAHGIDPLTSLPAAANTRREVQKRAVGGEAFALAACEFLGLREFARKFGEEARNRAVQYFARVLQHGGEAMDAKQFFLGHMGSGHFLCILTPRIARDYCAWAREAWLSNLEKLFRSIGGSIALAANLGAEGPRLLDVVFCATIKEPTDTATTQQLFETLRQIRHTVLDCKQGGVHMDRRTAH